MAKAFWHRQTFPMTSSAVPVVPVGTYISHLEINNNSGSAVTFSGSAIDQAFSDVMIWTVPANSNYAVHRDPYHDVYFPNGLQITSSAGNVVVVSGTTL